MVEERKYERVSVPECVSVSVFAEVYLEHWQAARP